MSDSQVSSYSDFRIGGLASGLDTDSIVENLMKVEKLKVFRIEQEKTYAEWEMEAYREVTDMINDFSNEQFNLVDSEKNILSSSSYKEVSYGEEQDAAVILANGDAVNGDYTLNEIVQLAKASSVESGSAVIGEITGTTDLSIGPIALTGKSFNIRLDGVQETITFDADYADITELKTALQSKLDSAYGAGRVTVSDDSGMYITLDSANSTLQVLQDVNGTDALAGLGLTEGMMNRTNTGGTLADVFGETEDVSFTINGVDFNFTADDTMTSVMKEINYSEAKVKMTYSSLSDTFTLTSTETGAGSTIEISNTTGSLFGASSYVNITADTVKNGQDAAFYMNNAAKDNLIYRSSNVFTVDGVTFSLKETSSEAIDFTVSDDIDQAMEKVTSFIESYNVLLSDLTSKINEHRDYDYGPLSDEQKEEMTDDEIDKWNEQAKLGILKSDSIVYNMVIELRNAFVEKIEGTDEPFFNIGVNTTSFTDDGKITIDEDKLRAAMENNLEQVMDMFTKSSDISYSRDLSSYESSERYSENGFAQRVNDIIKKNVTTVRNENGYKGLLLEKAGLKGDTSEFTSTLYKRIEDIEERIDDANEAMYDTEDRYWSEFATLETTIQRMNEQSSWLMSQI